MNPRRRRSGRNTAASRGPLPLFQRATWVRLWQRLRRAPADSETADAGQWGEAQAEAHLRKSGYRILGRRVRTAHREEIDLIAAQDDTLVFVEVKTRRNEAFGQPAEAIGRDKRLMLSRAAVRYLTRLRRPPAYARFDVVEIIGQKDHGHPEVRHIENAFEPEGGWRPS